MLNARRVILYLVALIATLYIHAEEYTVPCGAMVEISATPQAGYHFVVWSDGSRDPIRRVEVTEAMSLTAHFAPDPPPANPEFTPEVSPSVLEPNAPLTISGLPDGQYAELTFFDSEGHKVQAPVYSSGHTSVQTNAPPLAGIYLLRITGIKETHSLRVLVK